MNSVRVGPPPRTTALLLELMLLGGLVLFCAYMARSGLLQGHPLLLASAISFDLTLTAALCHWLLGVRVAGLPTWTVVPVMLGGAVVCRAVLPRDIEHADLLPLATIALAEGSAIVLGLLRVRTVVRGYRAAKLAGADGFDALETGFLAIMPSLPRVAAWARLEIQLWTLALVGWSFKRQPANGQNVFTHHKQANWFAILGVIAFLLVSEAGVAHVWLHSTRHDTAKWIMLAMHAYCMIWLLGELQGTRIYRSALVQKDGQTVLQLRVGLRGSSEVARANISQAEVGSWTGAAEDEALLSLQGSANIKLTFRALQPVKQLLSEPKQVRVLLLHVDDTQAFAAALAAAQP